MENEVIIRVENVSKQYRLGAIGGSTLTEDLQSWIAKIRGKEDPNTKIGSAQIQKGKRFWALDNINFEVKKGERIGIIGHNGAGKSTFLKLLSRVTAPTTGKISYNGKIASMLEVGTGFHGELTGRENVYMNGAILGMTKKEIDSKFDAIVKFSEMEQFIDTPVKRYSSGMYVKLAFAVAAHLDSDIMIMDEVLAVGDMKFQQKCLGKMDGVSKEEGKTILYVSHNMKTIRQLCTRCIVLSHGKLIFDGDVEEAIAIYMNEDIDRRIKYDYKDLKRPVSITRNAKFEELEFTGKDSNIFSRGEELKFDLVYRGFDDVNVGLRLEIISADETPIGAAFLSKPMEITKGGCYKISVGLDTSNIAPGRYKVTALLFEFDQRGNHIGADWVSPLFTFEIVQNDETTINWDHKFWGNVHFDDMKLYELTEIKAAND